MGKFNKTKRLEMYLKIHQQVYKYIILFKNTERWWEKKIGSVSTILNFDVWKLDLFFEKFHLARCEVVIFL